MPPRLQPEISPSSSSGHVWDRKQEGGSIQGPSLPSEVQACNHMPPSLSTSPGFSPIVLTQRHSSACAWPPPPATPLRVVSGSVTLLWPRNHFLLLSSLAGGRSRDKTDYLPFSKVGTFFAEICQGRTRKIGKLRRKYSRQDGRVV